MDFLSELAHSLGPTGWLWDPDRVAPYKRDWLDRFGIAPLGVARPASTKEVADTVRLCRAAKVKLVPQGGRTGLVGASVATEPDTVVISLERLNQIEAVDAADLTARVGAGVVLSQLHTALEAQDLQFPLHLGSVGSAQIGGLIATNAGGSHAFRFGMMQDLVLGLEVVLPDGKIWNGM